MKIAKKWEYWLFSSLWIVSIGVAAIATACYLDVTNNE